MEKQNLNERFAQEELESQPKIPIWCDSRGKKSISVAQNLVVCSCSIVGASCLASLSLLFSNPYESSWSAMHADFCQSIQPQTPAHQATFAAVTYSDPLLFINQGTPPVVGIPFEVVDDCIGMSLSSSLSIKLSRQCSLVASNRLSRLFVEIGCIDNHTVSPVLFLLWTL